MDNQEKSTLGEVLRIYGMPVSLRLLFLMTAISLTIGFVFNLAQIVVHHHDKNASFFSVSPGSIRAAYYGKRDSSTLELKLDGVMGRYTSAEEKTALTSWIRNGSNEELYNTQIKDIFEKNCVLCHSAHSFRSLASYEDVKKVTEIDRGMGLETLVRVSHIHFNGMTSLFFMSGFITCFASIRVRGWRWVKWIVIVLPMAAMIMDILSWNIARTYENGIYIVMASGALMTAAFFTQMGISIYQLIHSFFRQPS